uniref:Tetraspanin n=1 Tax=Lepisosteus oculatus TaxID=7918 RepID=W5N1Y4_LEPOC
MAYGGSCCLLQVSGIALIIVGEISRTSYNEFESFTGGGLSHIAVLLIVVGVAISITAFLGCLGAWLDNSILLGLFTGILILILTLEIVAGILFYVFRAKVESKITKKAKEVIKKYDIRDRAIIDDIQDQFHCCGAENYTDWFVSGGWKNHRAVPDSCCRLESEDCGHIITSDNIYLKGCVKSIKEFLKKNLVWIGAACIALGLVEILGVVLGVCLLNNILRRGSYDVM